MSKLTNTIHQTEDLEEIKNILLKQENIQNLRDEIFSEFLKYSDYKCISDWNKAVRICESLAIIG